MKTFLIIFILAEIVGVVFAIAAAVTAKRADCYFEEGE